MTPVGDAISTMAELIRCDGRRSRFDGLAAFGAGGVGRSAQVITTSEAKGWSLTFEGFGNLKAHEASENLELLAIEDYCKDQFNDPGQNKSLVPIEALKNESSDQADNAERNQKRANDDLRISPPRQLPK